MEKHWMDWETCGPEVQLRRLLRTSVLALQLLRKPLTDSLSWPMCPGVTACGAGFRVPPLRVLGAACSPAPARGFSTTDSPCEAITPGGSVWLVYGSYLTRLSYRLKRRRKRTAITCGVICADKVQLQLVC